MDIQQEIRCKVCNKKMEYLDHELINLNIHKSGDPIGLNKLLKAVNVRFYCGICKVNFSKPYPFDNESVVPLFIADIKSNSVKFDRREYLSL